MEDLRYLDAESATADELDALVEVISDPMLFIEMTLKIQNKRGDLVPFCFNTPQRKLYEEVKRQRDEGRPVRIIILKARQMGFSSAVSALFYYNSATSANTNSMVIAHKADASTNIFNKMKLYYETSPEILRPARKASNAKEIIFENPTTNGLEKKKNPGLRSRIEIESAVNKDAARGKTIHNLHMSELAFWPYPEETMTAAMQAVPNEPATAVIIESTGNGVGGKFYEEWMRAERGESEFVPIFFAWFDHEEYRMPVPDDFTVTDEEQQLKEQYGLDDEQLVWRRWCISANCMGDIDLFHQEYPATPREAFLSSGRPVFDTVRIEEALRNAAAPAFSGRVVEENRAVRFRTEYKGVLSIWEKPKDGREYVIGIDPASGDQNGDFSAMAVFDRKSQKMVAEWHGKIPPDILGEEATYLGRYYNLAWLVPEANNHGVSVIDSIKRLHYPKLFRRPSSPDDKKEASMQKYGFWTSTKSKKLLVDVLAKFLREKAGNIPSKEALNECLTYMYDDKGASNAQDGCYDDRVIAMGLAIYYIHKFGSGDMPYVSERLSNLYSINSVTGY